MDGRRSLEELRDEHAARFPLEPLTVDDVEQFARQAISLGLASADSPMLGQRLYERKQRTWRRKLLRAPQQLLSIRVPLVDPDRALARMLPWFGWCFAPVGVALAGALCLSALLLLAFRWPEIHARLPNFEELLTFKHLLGLWVAMALAKVLQELGHGLACKRWGGEVHDMGLLLVFSPCLYCNVSDAARFTSRWRRAAVGAAGIYVEAVLAAACLWLWRWNDPGALNSLFLDLATVSSVNTVLFNGNPLLRFDGYYVLCDVLNVPNLPQRANRRLGNLAARVAAARHTRRSTLSET